jgi:hypothetical protein
VRLELGPLSLVSTIEELLERKSSGSGLENRESVHRGSSALVRATPLYPQKLALSSSTSGGRSVCMVRSRTQTTSLVSVFSLPITYMHSFSPSCRVHFILLRFIILILLGEGSKL